MKTFADFGIAVPDILLPKNIDTATWGAIACDQYTQSAEYWKGAEKAALGKPSTLNLILPEIYLGSDGASARIDGIKREMRRYLDGGVFAEPFSGFVYVERETRFGRKRRGLVAAIDLDKYEWKPGGEAVVRATERTIMERIPPRKAIREGAALECPHIMLLADDPPRVFVEAVGEKTKAQGLPPLYDGPLMMGGGRVAGWRVPRSLDGFVLDALAALEGESRAPFLFAAGDGNHSLATAKAVWDEMKAGMSKEERDASRARFALAEIVNIHDEGLVFEPIHRVVFCGSPESFAERLARALGGAKEISCLPQKRPCAATVFSAGGALRFAELESAHGELEVARVQEALDFLIGEERAKGGVASIDYIHGEGEVVSLARKGGALGVILPPIDKSNFFATISARGTLPRKSFSMGEADEKRFYMECRAL